MLPLVTMVEPLPPMVVVTVGFDSARAVLPVVILIRPPPRVSRLLDVTALPSARTDRVRAPAPPLEEVTLPSMFAVVQPPVFAHVWDGMVGSGPVAVEVGLAMLMSMTPPVALFTRASAMLDE